MRRRIVHVVNFVAFGLIVAAAATPGYAQDTSPRCAAPQASAGDLFSIDLESLMDMKVVTASKFEENARDAPGVVSVISRDDLRRFGGVTLREVLDRVPGLSFATGLFTERSILTARGNQTRPNSSHILFLIDGRPTREIQEGGIVTDLVESFPLSAIERIEVVKGPGSVLYGSNAFSAVVNLITIKPDRAGMAVAAIGGSAGAFNANGHAVVTCGRFSLLGAGQFQQMTDWTPTIHSLDFFTGAPSAIPASVQGHGPGAFMKASYRGLTATGMFAGYEFPVFLDPTRERRRFVDIGYAAAVNGAWDVAINASYTQHLVTINSLPSADRDSKDVVLEWSNTVRASARTTVTFGGLYNHMHGEEVYFGVTPSVTVADGRRHNGAVYSQLDYRLHPTLKAIGGFQANKQGALSLDVVPRAGLVWNPATHLNVKVLWGRAFRAPAINETVIVHPGLVGNPLLEPEKVDSFDLAMTYRSDRFEGGVSYFRNHETNSIVLSGAAPPFSYLNLGEATFHGFELHSKYYVNRRVYLVGSTLYQQNRDGAGVEDVAPVANFGAKLGVSYQADFGLTGSVFDSYQEAVSTPQAQLNPAQDARHLVHARVRFDLSRHVRTSSAGALALVLHVNNLRNTEIWSRDVASGFGTLPVDSGRVVYVGAEFALGGARANR